MKLKWWRRRREPSIGLCQANAALEQIRSKNEEVEHLGRSLLRVRLRNGLGPLIEEAVRSIR